MTGAWTPVVAPENIVIDAARFTESHPPARTKHLFVVEHRGGELILHIAPAEHHKNIVADRGIAAETIVGGGLVCILAHGGEATLWLGGKSGDFDAIPPDAQALFAAPLADLLRQRGMAIDGAHGDHHAMGLNAFWR